MTLGERIKKRREELNITQEELANSIGYKSKSTINKIEKDINDIPMNKIKDFSKALKVSKEYIMGWEQEDIKLTKFEKENIIKKIEDYLKSQNITIKTLKEKFDISNFDTNIVDSKLYDILDYYKISIDKGKYLNKRITRISDIRSWFINNIEKLSDSDLEKIKPILENVLEMINK